MQQKEREAHAIESHPVRGAWIEMQDKETEARLAVVAPREGCVD